jgi:hypothetical protein
LPRQSARSWINEDVAMKRDDYLLAVAADLCGPHAARKRLLVELRDHIDDAIAEEVSAGRTQGDAEQTTLARFGSPIEIAGAWRANLRSRRRETRKRAALLTLAAATACALAVAQHASGLRQPISTCAKTTATGRAMAHEPPCPSPVNVRHP